MKQFTPPFRLGRKQQRAILDSNGIEYVILPKESFVPPQDIVDLLNMKTSMKEINVNFGEQNLATFFYLNCMPKTQAIGILEFIKNNLLKELQE